MCDPVVAQIVLLMEQERSLILECQEVDSSSISVALLTFGSNLEEKGLWGQPVAYRGCSHRRSPLHAGLRRIWHDFETLRDPCTPQTEAHHGDAVVRLAGRRKVNWWRELGGERQMSEAAGYWGPVTASIDWCETNYAWSPFVAEFWNTLTSLAIFFAGIYGWRIAVLDNLEMRFQVSQLLVASVGMGSACFHCTLRHVEQQCDETPMVLTLLNWFYELFADTWEHNSFLSAAMPALLVVYGVGFAVLHNSYRWTTFFQVHFIVGAMINLARCIYVSREKGVGPARGLLKRSMIATVLAGFCWMTDFHFCGHLQSGGVPNPEGHAWWHLFIAYAILQCTSFSIYRRCTQLGIPVIITKGPLGVWPSVRVVQQAMGSKAVSPVGVDAATEEPRVVPTKSKSDPRFAAMACQASAPRLRKYSCNLKK